MAGRIGDPTYAEAFAGNSLRVAAIESEINPPAAQLCGLTGEELKEIQESLEELG